MINNITNETRLLSYQHRSTHSTAAMHTAFGRIEAVKFLISHKAALNIPNRLGNTALLYAGRFGHADVARALLEAGADKNSKRHTTNWTIEKRKPRSQQKEKIQLNQTKNIDKDMKERHKRHDL